ncbi:hypothetical protein LEP1GSC075_2878, partial [Leptospira interrogans str. Kito]
MVLHETDKTLTYNCESDRSENTAMQYDFKHEYIGIYGKL